MNMPDEGSIYSNLVLYFRDFSVYINFLLKVKLAKIFMESILTKKEILAKKLYSKTNSCLPVRRLPLLSFFLLLKHA